MTESGADMPEVTPAVKVEEVAAVAARPSWKARLWEWLELAGKRIGVPAFIVAPIALGVSSTGLGFIIANYRLTVSANRPLLVSYGLAFDLTARPPYADVGFNNVGKVTARRGMVTLFSLAQADATPDKIASRKIVWRGNEHFPWRRIFCEV